MSQLVVGPSKIRGKIEAQPSKSYTHRFLAIALLADGKSRIKNPLLSLDTKATLGAVQFYGSQIKEIENSWKITGTAGNLSPRGKIINVGNSGTTLRFMTAISALSPEKVKLIDDESILKRPVGPLVDSLKDLGADARCEGIDGRPPVIVGGGLEGGETRITGAISSQFISALLIASPYSEVGMDLEVEEELRSKPYVQMTLNVLEQAGADIREDSYLTSFSVPGKQVFSPVDCSVPGDFSSASYILGAGVLSEDGVEVSNLDPGGVQGDKRILEILEDFGAEVKVRGKNVQVKHGGRLSGVDVDCGDTPDLVPILAVLGSIAEGKTRLYNVPHLRYKEVDRIKAISTELRKLGVEVEELGDGLKIFGTRQLPSAHLNSYGDHRMAMSLAVAGLAADGRVKIDGAESIGVSYPDFVEDLQKLGGKIEIID